MPHAVIGTDPEAGERHTRRTGDRLMPRRSALALLGASALVPLQACSSLSSSPPSAADAGTSEALHFLGLQEVGRLIASREISAVDLTHECWTGLRKLMPP